MLKFVVICCLAEVTEESLGSHGYSVGREESVLLVFSHNCGSFALILHEDLTSVILLQLAQRGSESHINELFILYCIKPTGLSCILNR